MLSALPSLSAISAFVFWNVQYSPNQDGEIHLSRFERDQVWASHSGLACPSHRVGLENGMAGEAFLRKLYVGIAEAPESSANEIWSHSPVLFVRVL